MVSRIAGLAGLLTLVGGAFGQTVLVKSAAGPGGAPGASASYRLNGTAGQAVQGPGASASFVGGWGFWYGFCIEEPPPPQGGWVEQSPMPLMPSGRAVKDGGWLVWDAGRGRFYAAKGYKTGDFYSFEPGSGWSQAADWPLGIEAKPPGKGAAGCATGNGVVYTTKGNNTTGFWRYDAGADAWQQLADVPLGPSNKKVKGGTDLAYVDAGDSQYIYLLKGYKAEFHRYNTALGTWCQLADAPAGVRPKWDKGSWLVLDEARGRLLAHKAKYHELHLYDLAAQAWNQAPAGMPVLCAQTGRSKKSKDGGSGAVLGDYLYALKGGNTQDFYSLSLSTLGWAEAETLPQFGYTAKKKRAKAGADLASDGSAVYALKGNKTLELWRYAPGTPKATRIPRPAQTGEQGLEREASRSLLAAQTPSRGTAAVRWSGLPSAAFRLAVYDAAGRCVRTAVLSGRSGSIELRALPPGVYLARITGGAELTRKLVIE